MLQMELSHFVNVTFCRLFISMPCHFVNYCFGRFVTLSTNYFIKSSFQLVIDILSTSNSVHFIFELLK
jgi:hypothetical protein